MPFGWAAAIGAVGSIVAGGEQASGQQAAANTQQNMFNTIVGQEQPFLQGGYGAEATLNQLMGYGGSGYGGSASTGGMGTGTPAPNGYDASSGYQMGPGGGISQMIPGGSAASASNQIPGGGHYIGGQPGAAAGSTFGGPSGIAGQGPPSGMGPVGGLGLPIQSGGSGPTSNVNGTGLPTGFLTQTFNPTQAQLENYPGYQFQLDQGNLALNSANSAGSSALSGAAMKNLMGFNQGLAASNFGNYFNQFETQQNNIFNRLSNIAAMGQNAAGNLGTAGANLGTGIAQAQAGAAGSIAGGIAGATNNIGQGMMMSNLMGGGSNNNPSNWDTENPSNFQDFASSGGS